MDLETQKETNENSESSESKLEKLRAEKKYYQDFKNYLVNYTNKETNEGDDDGHRSPSEKVLVKHLDFRGKKR